MNRSNEVRRAEEISASKAKYYRRCAGHELSCGRRANCAASSTYNPDPSPPLSVTTSEARLLICHYSFFRAYGLLVERSSRQPLQSSLREPRSHLRLRSSFRRHPPFSGLTSSLLNAYGSKRCRRCLSAFIDHRDSCFEQNGTGFCLSSQISWSVNGPPRTTSAQRPPEKALLCTRFWANHPGFINMTTSRAAHSLWQTFLLALQFANRGDVHRYCLFPSFTT